MQMVVGIDEVGRGCWAGPLVAGAVLLGSARIPGLGDSKSISKRQRTMLDLQIRKQAVSFGLGWVTARYIDRHGLTAAVRQAMQHALRQINIPYDSVIIDGSYNFLGDNPKAVTCIGGDRLVEAVGAASIIAKVARDGYMAESCSRYPQYGFASNAGYGTAWHAGALKQHGICRLHRRSFRPVSALLMGNQQ